MAADQVMMLRGSEAVGADDVRMGGVWAFVRGSEVVGSVARVGAAGSCDGSCGPNEYEPTATEG